MMSVVTTAAGDFEARVRREALAWLAVRSNDGTREMTSEEILEFSVDGERFRLMDAQRGIRKPHDFAAALSIRTVYTASDKQRPYEDSIGTDGLVRYKWRGTDADHAENRALREAMYQQVPLIWFFGVGVAKYLPVFPVFVVDEHRAAHEFAVAHEQTLGLVQFQSPVEETARRYVMRETRQRLHQPVFRAMVMRAYQERCAVCSLHYRELLDAAHIVADADEGIAAVRNGLAMCKIHHAAYDQRILGVRPDLVVEIRRDLLDEVDGPMLKYGLQERHGQRLMSVPTARNEQPDPELLEASYERFRAAG